MSSGALSVDRPESAYGSLAPSTVVSLVIHAVALIGIPLLSTVMRREVVFARPQTFQLVRPPSIPQRPRAVSRPKESVPARNPSPTKQAQPEPVKDDLTELEDLLQAMPSPTQVTGAVDHRFHWYLNAVQQQAERFWRPPTESRDVSVVVAFTIFSDGSISGVTVKESSGNPTLDNLAVKAVESAAPFGRLPPGFGGDRLDLECVFRPVRR